MSGVIAALITAMAAIAGAAVTYHLTKRREIEAEWRKLRLDRYQEFLKAFSAVTRAPTTSDERAAYSDAVNNLTLVAPATVLTALYRFQDAVSKLESGMPDTEAELAASELVPTMRRDVRPVFSQTDMEIRIRFLAP